MLVTKIFYFDAAHFLPNYHGKCEELHGHTYRLDVIVSGEIRDGGMVMDFVELKELVRKYVLNKLDHKNLNDILKEPSAENIALFVWDALCDKFESGVSLFEVRVWEGRDSYVSYRK